MPDSAAKKEWMKNNSVMVSVKFMRKSDAKLIEYLESQEKTGEKKSAIIKLALTEYIANHTPTEYRYGMRLRGFSPGAQPRGSIRREDDASGKYHDILVYDRQLSAAEIADYELDDLN